MATTLVPRLARRTLTLTPALGPTDRERPGRWLLNISVAAVGLVLALPLMLLIGLLIKLTSRGPVLFKQTRIGLDRRALSRMGGNTRRRIDLGGQPYTMYKLRTMCLDDRGVDRQVWAQPDDARVTPIGRLLRRLRLDELPQLFNVLKGDMNVVGPRPALRRAPRPPLPGRAPPAPAVRAPSPGQTRPAPPPRARGRLPPVPARPAPTACRCPAGPASQARPPAPPARASDTACG